MTREIKFKAKRLDNNEFKIYPEFPKYGVSKNGIICSFDYNHSGKLKHIHSYKDRDGYLYVFLFVGGRRYKRLVHRMVLTTYALNPENKPQVNHKNGIRDDNRLENLEWVTSQENCIHSYKCNGRKHTDKQRKLASIRFSENRNPKAKASNDVVKSMRNDRNSGMLLKDIAKKYNLSISQCSQICANKFWNKDIYDEEVK